MSTTNRLLLKATMAIKICPGSTAVSDRIKSAAHVICFTELAKIIIASTGIGTRSFTIRSKVHRTDDPQGGITVAVVQVQGIITSTRASAVIGGHTRTKVICIIIRSTAAIHSLELNAGWGIGGAGGYCFGIIGHNMPPFVVHNQITTIVDKETIFNSLELNIVVIGLFVDGSLVGVCGSVQSVVVDPIEIVRIQLARGSAVRNSGSCACLERELGKHWQNRRQAQNQCKETLCVSFPCCFHRFFPPEKFFPFIEKWNFSCNIIVLLVVSVKGGIW